MGSRVILTQERDARLVTVRRGGALLDADHRLLAVWAADCAQRVIHLFERAQPAETVPARRSNRRALGREARSR